MKSIKLKVKGFTLVELLIVIALIAILSVAVLATINPIEQSNKARDSKFKNNAAEVLNAYERYYASQNIYPWNDTLLTNVVAKGTNNVAFVSRDPRFGVLDESHTQNGSLISTSELKSAFAGNEPFVSTVTANDEDAMYVFHTIDSNYVCFCPKAKANKQGTPATGLKCLSGVPTEDAQPSGITMSNATLNGSSCRIPTSADIELDTFCTLGSAWANLMCVPEGEIQ